MANLFIRVINPVFKNQRLKTTTVYCTTPLKNLDMNSVPGEILHRALVKSALKSLPSNENLQLNNEDTLQKLSPREKKNLKSGQSYFKPIPQSLN